MKIGNAITDQWAFNLETTMDYRIEKNRMVLTVNETERAWLRAQHEELGQEEFDRDSFMYDMLEWMVTNDEFQWIAPFYTGDLTDAPMLAILGDEENGIAEQGSGLVPCGSGTVHPIIQRWAYMDYAVDTIQRDLLNDGVAYLMGGALVEREGQLLKS